MKTPMLKPGYRLQINPEKKVLLFPEGIVELNDSAVAILELCDGQHTVKEMAATLETRFSTSGLFSDIESFIQDATEQGWLLAHD